LLWQSVYADADTIVLRQLSLNSSGINHLIIDSGPGDLSIRGQSDSSEIAVASSIDVSPAYSGDDPDSFVEQNITLTLERRGRTATLTAGMGLALGMSRSPEIDLEISVPKDLEIEIRDESGSINISGFDADVFVANGPGNIQINDIGGQLSIEDTSGRIVVENIRADVQITDRSGSITIRDIDGTVFVTDSSGNITVERISQDLVIEQDTSGKLNTKDIGGQIIRNDRQ
jgi:hypothetical protein